MINIEEFGIQEGISEVILSTISLDGVPNAAPIGIHRKDGRLFAHIYNSKTLENILEKPLAAANFVDDPILFVQSALSDMRPERFEFIEGFPVLKDTNGWILFDCRCIKQEKLSVIELSPVKGKIYVLKIKPVNRGFNAVIEATVHATRYIVHREKKFIEQIDYYSSIVKKCGSSKDKEAMRFLYEKLDLKPNF